MKICKTIKIFMRTLIIPLKNLRGKMLRLNSNENRGNNFTIKENDNKKEIRKEGFF